MSTRSKKSTLEMFRERSCIFDDLGRTPISLSREKISGGDKTPANTGLLDNEKKKQRSSLKKIKKFLGSHSKKKLKISDSSPMLEQTKASEAASKQTLLKKRASVKSNDSASIKQEGLSRETSGSSIPSMKKSNSQKLGSQVASRCGRASSNVQTRLCGTNPPSAKRSASGTVVNPAKRLRLSTASDSNSPEWDSEEEIRQKPDGKRGATAAVTSGASGANGLSYWNPTLNRTIQSTLVSHDSSEDGAKLFESIIQPVAVSKFFKDIWEKKPLLVRRHNLEYNNGWFSSAELDEILRREKVMFGENVDVVTYINGKRETHNPPGRAFPAVVWDFYQQGCSVRLLNPGTYSKNVWKMLATLQEYFGCVAGANIYLTPAGSQGFAPHYDDIEAFILQLEGKKHWKVYEPRSESEVLPRYSSPNFTEADLNAEPVLDIVLEAGDLLYFPKGYIHQGRTLDDAHSLHMTVSVGQKNSWADLLEKILPRAIEVAQEEDVEFRRSLPRDFFNYMGIAFQDENCPRRQRFLRTIEQLMMKLISHAPIDAACDQMAKKFLEDSLPPHLSEAEEQRSIFGSGEKWDAAHQRVTGTAELDPDTEIKIIRRGCLRLVSEESVCVYHNLDNARLYHGAQSQCIEVEPDEAEAVEFLLKAYPDFVPVESLPMDSQQKQLELVNTLYERGLLLTKEPLEPIDGEEEEEEEEEN